MQREFIAVRKEMKEIREEMADMREVMATKAELGNMEKRLMGAIKEVSDSVGFMISWSKEVDRRLNVLEEKSL